MKLGQKKQKIFDPEVIKEEMFKEEVFIALAWFPQYNVSLS